MATTKREKTMRVPRQALALAMAAALSAGAGSALAAEPGPDTLAIHVISVQTDTADDQAEALTKALRAAVRAMPGWSQGAGDYSLEVLALSLKCADPPDASCQSRIADQIKSDRYIWGTLKKVKGTQNVKGELHLWVRGKGTSTVPLDYAANLTEANDDALKRIAGDAVNNLTGGPPKGPIHVRAGDVAGQVFVDGQPIGALKAGDGTFLVPSGSHKVTVKAIGYADVESQVVVKPAGAPAELTLTMVPVAAKSTFNLRKVGGYGALGLGVVSGVVGLVSSLQVNGVLTNDQYHSYRTKQPTSPDRCADAAGMGMFPSPNADIVALCNKGKTFQTMQIVFYPVAAIAGGLGIYLIATSGKSAPAPKTGFNIDPQIGPGGGKLDLSYKW
jgi:hypothetical protein